MAWHSFDKTRPMPPSCRTRNRKNLHGRAYFEQLWLAQPVWADRCAIGRIYKEAKRRGLEVDHIVPLNHPYVSGLHVPANLTLLSPNANRAKSNHWWTDSWADQPDLDLELTLPHQCRLL